MKMMAVRTCKFVFLFDCLTVGCQLCMGHAVDNDLLSLVQTQVKGIIKDLTLQSTKLFQIQKTAAVLQQQLSSQKVRLDDHDARFDVVEEKLQEDEDTRREEMKIILERLAAIQKTITGELLRRVQGVEGSLAATNIKMEQLGQRAAKTDDKMEQLGQRAAKTDDKMEQLGQRAAKTDDKMEQLGQRAAKTDDKVEQLEHGKMKQLQEGLTKTSNRVDQLEHKVKSQMMKDVKQG